MWTTLWIENRRRINWSSAFLAQIFHELFSPMAKNAMPRRRGRMIALGLD